ncbi:MAG: phosphoribosylanthranilate isomerase [Acidobacteria bacterium]|nr:phosphoribosylanthranilate isomerase [Acidobacteriota bacterium]
MWVKICANTNLDDALLAAELGADALGFVFAESKRKVTAQQVARITPHLPAEIEKAGVFHTHSAEEIVRAVEEAGLTTVQLHGGLDVALTEKLKQQLPSIKLIQTLHWVADGSADSTLAVAEQIEKIRRNGTTDRVLIDSRVGQAIGGTGVTFDWKSAGQVFEKAGRELKIIAAGGLKPDNLAEAMALMHPWGVDVASGVEASPGRKDPEKLKSFLQIARS